MNYKSISDLNNTILKRLYILPRDFDLIVGIPRSGMFPANLLALYLNRPVTDLGSFINGHIYRTGERGKFIDVKDFKKILVIDDSLGSGSAMLRCKDQLKDLENVFEIKYGVIYGINNIGSLVDYVFETVPLPRYFQWNILNHTILEKACVDIDGVLCVDPKPEENDDGERYKNFLLQAKPLFIPGAKIGTIVTSRLEKYRMETETWLDKNNVKYNKLVMLNLPNQEARQKANCHASHKANEYRSNIYNIFIESSLNQALNINRLTGKPVLCTENFEMIYNNQSFIYNIKSGQSFPIIKKTLLKLRNLVKPYKAKH